MSPAVYKYIAKSCKKGKLFVEKNQGIHFNTSARQYFSTSSYIVEIIFEML